MVLQKPGTDPPTTVCSCTAGQRFSFELDDAVGDVVGAQLQKLQLLDDIHGSLLRNRKAEAPEAFSEYRLSWDVSEASESVNLGSLTWGRSRDLSKLVVFLLC